jgi:hypothetical protein
MVPLPALLADHERLLMMMGTVTGIKHGAQSYTQAVVWWGFCPVNVFLLPPSFLLPLHSALCSV